VLGPIELSLVHSDFAPVLSEVLERFGAEFAHFFGWRSEGWSTERRFPVACRLRAFLFKTDCESGAHTLALPDGVFKFVFQKFHFLLFFRTDQGQVHVTNVLGVVVLFVLHQTSQLLPRLFHFALKLLLLNVPDIELGLVLRLFFLELFFDDG
jgi:hypothetical protein